MGKNSVYILLAGGLIGVAARADSGAVLESAPREMKSTKTGEAPAPAPSQGWLPELANLPEPMGIFFPARPKSNGAAPVAPKAAAPTGVVNQPAANAEKEAEGTSSAHEGTCLRGERPMGACDCLDERAGRVQLRIHPSAACIEAEAKRLGRRPILRNGDGTLGLGPEDAASVAERDAEASSREAEREVAAKLAEEQRLKKQKELEALRRQQLAAEQQRLAEEAKPKAEEAKPAEAQEQNLADKTRALLAANFALANKSKLARTVSSITDNDNDHCPDDGSGHHDHHKCKGTRNSYCLSCHPGGVPK